MPQTSPMNWLILSIMMISVSLIIMTFLSFSLPNTNKIKKISYSNYSMKW